jgi:hypothetical protein
MGIHIFSRRRPVKPARGNAARLTRGPCAGLPCAAATLLASVVEDDSTQLAVNVEAARSDPNVRVYRNIAVIEADRTFNDAVQNAYRATRVFEYFSSQTYAKLGDLFARMVSSGDHTLEAYLAGLGAAYTEFQQKFGQADTRVVTLSLKDDLLAIPKLGAQGQALSIGDRNELFHQKLKSPDLLDGNGYLTIPFSTTLAAVSPLTSNHQIAYVEAESVGSDVGDTLRCGACLPGFALDGGRARRRGRARRSAARPRGAPATPSPRASTRAAAPASRARRTSRGTARTCGPPQGTASLKARRGRRRG